MGPGLAPEIVRFAEARARSRELRLQLGELSRTVRHELATAAEVTPASLARLRELKRQYWPTREALFELALLHASAVVERIGGGQQDVVLARTSLSLLAATELVDNFHALAGALSHAAVLREAWNEADASQDIPAGLWTAALDAYRYTGYQDLFQRALERLTLYQEPLERARAAGAVPFAALYPDGVEPALAAAGRAHALLRARVAEEDLSADLARLERLVERSKAARAAWRDAAPGLREAIARDGGLIRGDVHLRIQGVKLEFLELREGLYGAAFKHFTKVTRDDIPYDPDVRLRAVAISLLAAVTLYDNAQQLTTHLLTIPGVKPLLNQGDPALGIRPRFWDYVEREFVRWEYRTLVESGLRALEPARVPDGRGALPDPVLAYVTRELTGSAAIADAGRDQTVRAVTLALRPYLRQLNIIEGGIVKDGRTQFSKLFGTVVYAFEFRKGKLFDQPAWEDFVRERLRPGDVLVEKSPFRLTDHLIPGHFGHVAMYLGTVDDLRRLGLDRHPWVTPHLAKVGEGRVIVEALREGTQLNSIAHFLNVDDLAILRPKPDRIPAADVRQAILLAFSHIGKQYDFGFDTNTWDTIVCSELAFQSYVNVRWSFAKVLDAYTIAPDDVAVFAGADPGRPFALVTFVHDGRVVHDTATGVDGEARYIALLGRRYADAIKR